MTHPAQAKIGDFCTVTQARLPDDEGTRQGIYLGFVDGVHCALTETGDQIEITEVWAIVPDKNLWGSTKDFVMAWRDQREQ